MNLDKKEAKLLSIVESFFKTHNSYPSYSYLSDRMDYKSKNSVSIIVKSLIDKNKLIRSKRGGFILADPIVLNEYNKTRSIPLVGDVSCGVPILAEENINGFYSISQKLLSKSKKYFLLKALGDSMNKSNDDREPINDGDLVLIEAVNVAKKGDWVLALIDGEATIKEFQPSSEFIALVPRSSNSMHKPILLHGEFQIQGIVKRVFADIDFV